MPYKIRLLKDGYKVCKRDNPNKCFSKKGLSLEVAKKQEKAIILSELKGGRLNNNKINIAKKLKDITKEKADIDYQKLKNINFKDINLRSIIGNTYLDYYFFPYRLDTITKRNINYYDFLNTKLKEEKKKKYFKTFYKYSKKNKNDDIQIYYKFFQLYYGSVNQFKPIIAKYIYEKYKPNSIIDIAAGWGGRMLAATTIENLKYTGFDTNTELKKPYEEIIKNLNVKNRIKIIFKDSSKIDYSKYKYDMVFSSPPYYTIELYENMPTYESKEDFNEKFLFPVIKNSYKYLKQNGYYILNIPINMYEDVKKILGNATEKIPLVISLRGNNYKEFIYVWKKNENIRGSGNRKIFIDYLRDRDIDPKLYLQLVKYNASLNGYNPKLISYSPDGKHKLMYNSPEGIKYFGASSYNDYIIYFLKNGFEYANKKRENYHKRFNKKSYGLYSPYELSLNILW
jgi:tRNA1(Val) A37 N6-methylase TrmN6